LSGAGPSGRGALRAGARLRALAPAKINLSLFLGPLQRDGRHQLVTLYESVSLVDELMLTLEPAGEHGADRVVCPAVGGENLAARALAELRDRGWDVPPAVVRIAKHIPIAAGMGGGSADAAAVLRMALAMSPELESVVGEVAGSLGADVPAQLVPGLSVGTGAGELVESLEPLAEHAVLVLPARERLRTADVYLEADRLALPRSAAELKRLEVELRGAARPGATLSGELLVNDLAGAAQALCPPVAVALEDALASGAQPALVCGSGPTVVGLFWGERASARASEAARALAPRYVGALAATPVRPGFGAPERLSV
jgi:4-diphosphocytidyl-2-C-methyl-D-erythritol kinase